MLKICECGHTGASHGADLGCGLCTCDSFVLRESSSTLKDSGERRTFDTGAQRDRGGEKGRPDLRPVHALHRLDVHMERGANKYDARNWEKGMPLSEYLNSAQRHIDKILAGYEDEPHDDAALWNLACYLETKYRIKVGILPEELDDLPHTFKDLEPDF